MDRLFTVRCALGSSEDLVWFREHDVLHLLVSSQARCQIDFMTMTVCTRDPKRGRSIDAYADPPRLLVMEATKLEDTFWSLSKTSSEATPAAFAINPVLASLYGF